MINTGQPKTFPTEDSAKAFAQGYPFKAIAYYCSTCVGYHVSFNNHPEPCKGKV